MNTLRSAMPGRSLSYRLPRKHFYISRPAKSLNYRRLGEISPYDRDVVKLRSCKDPLVTPISSQDACERQPMSFIKTLSEEPKSQQTTSQELFGDSNAKNKNPTETVDNCRQESLKGDGKDAKVRQIITSRELLVQN